MFPLLIKFFEKVNRCKTLDNYLKKFQIFLTNKNKVYGYIH